MNHVAHPARLPRRSSTVACQRPGNGSSTVLAPRLRGKPSTARMCAAYVEGILVPRLGRMRLGELRHTDVECLISDLAALRSPSRAFTRCCRRGRPTPSDTGRSAKAFVFTWRKPREPVPDFNPSEILCSTARQGVKGVVSGGLGRDPQVAPG